MSKDAKVTQVTQKGLHFQRIGAVAKNRKKVLTERFAVSRVERLVQVLLALRWISREIEEEKLTIRSNREQIISDFPL